MFKTINPQNPVRHTNMKNIHSANYLNYFIQFFQIFGQLSESTLPKICRLQISAIIVLQRTKNLKSLQKWMMENKSQLHITRILVLILTNNQLITIQQNGFFSDETIIGNNNISIAVVLYVHYLKVTMFREYCSIHLQKPPWIE